MNKHNISGSPQTPFSWEHLPGISKINLQMDENRKSVSVHKSTKLQPPPNSSTHLNLKSMSQGMYIPLPPCRFQPNQTQNRKGVTRPEEDPFLAAFIECTKPVNEKRIPVKQQKRAFRSNSWSRFERLTTGLGLSCKSSSVMEGNLVKLPKLPELDRKDDFDW